MARTGFDIDKWVMQRELDEQRDDPHESIYFTEQHDEDMEEA